MILIVLPHAAVDDQQTKERAVTAGANWVMGMQSKDGGFAAFDADNDSHWLNHVPLADVEAVTDPTCADLTGRVLEMMGAVGYRAEHPVARRAIRWLKRNQSRRRRMVGTLGRQLHLRHVLRAGGLARGRRRSEAAVDSASGRVAQVQAELRRWMGRESAQR